MFLYIILCQEISEQRLVICQDFFLSSFISYISNSTNFWHKWCFSCSRLAWLQRKTFVYSFFLIALQDIQEKVVFMMNNNIIRIKTHTTHLAEVNWNSASWILAIHWASFAKSTLFVYFHSYWSLARSLKKETTAQGSRANCSKIKTNEKQMFLLLTILVHIISSLVSRLS